MTVNTDTTPQRASLDDVYKALDINNTRYTYTTDESGLQIHTVHRYANPKRILMYTLITLFMAALMMLYGDAKESLSSSQAMMALAVLTLCYAAYAYLWIGIDPALTKKENAVYTTTFRVPEDIVTAFNSRQHHTKAKDCIATLYDIDTDSHRTVAEKNELGYKAVDFCMEEIQRSNNT